MHSDWAVTWGPQTTSPLLSKPPLFLSTVQEAHTCHCGQSPLPVACSAHGDLGLDVSLGLLPGSVLGWATTSLQCSELCPGARKVYSLSYCRPIICLVLIQFGPFCGPLESFTDLHFQHLVALSACSEVISSGKDRTIPKAPSCLHWTSQAVQLSQTRASMSQGHRQFFCHAAMLSQSSSQASR